MSVIGPLSVQRKSSAKVMSRLALTSKPLTVFGGWRNLTPLVSGQHGGGGGSLVAVVILKAKSSGAPPGSWVGRQLLLIGGPPGQGAYTLTSNCWSVEDFQPNRLAVPCEG